MSESQAATSHRGLWSSRLAFILAATGSAVGLGNIWKFPYVTGENGGGAFVLVYLLCIAVIGVPILMAEVLIGRSGRHNPIMSIRLMAERNARSSLWRAPAIIGMLAAFIILSFYSVIGGWSASYVSHAASGDFTGQTPEAIGELFGGLLADPGRLLLWHSIFMTLVVLVVAQGLKSGLERAVNILMPALFVLLLITVGYGMTTGHFGEAASFLFTPDFSALSVDGWLIALGHAFFTLSLGMAIMMAYGSFLSQDVSIGRTAVMVGIMDTVVALLAGLAIFPVVFANNLEPSAGPGLIFETLPLAFGNMPMGSLFGTLFFILLLFAAWTSGISLLEPVTEWLEERITIGRGGCAVMVGFACWALGVASILSFNEWSGFAPLGMFDRFSGMTIFDLLDYFTANIMLPLSGLLTAIFIGWFVARQALQTDIALQGRSFSIWYNLIRFVSPVAVLIVFIYQLSQ